MSDVRVDHLSIVGDPERWRAIGLHVTDQGHIPFLFTSLHVRDDAGRDAGIDGWALSGIDPDVTAVDGLVTRAVPAREPSLAEHPNGAVELDHVVVLTGSLERTSAAVAETTGSPLKRVREVGTMRQGFHRVGRGGLIVEIVERPEVDADHAAFWGVVVNVRDLDAAVAMLGPELIGDATDAVQPGRRIATVRREAGLGVPVALMSPAH